MGRLEKGAVYKRQPTTCLRLAEDRKLSQGENKRKAMPMEPSTMVAGAPGGGGDKFTFTTWNEAHAARSSNNGRKRTHQFVEEDQAFEII